MNIGIFTDTYYPLVNGVVTSTILLERELTKLGHKVYIFTTSNPDEKSISPRVFRLPSMPFVFLPSQRVTIMYSPKLLRYLGRFEFDVIHTQTEFSVGIFGRIVAGFYKVPCIHTYHTMYEDYVHYIGNGRLVTKRMAKRYSRVFCNRAKAVIAPTRKTSELLRRYGVRKPIRVIPTGIDFEPFLKTAHREADIQALREKFGLSQTDNVILFLGRLAKEKSIDVLISQMPVILDKLPHAKFLIVGDGPARDHLEALAKKLSVSNAVIFAGEQPWHSIGRFYQLGDVFISSSTSETQGLTYVEAMASGLPVVAKNDLSIAELVKPGQTGFTFEQSAEIPGILHEIVTNPQHTGQIVQNAWESIQSLSSQQFARHVEALYQETIEKGKTKYKGRIKPHES